MSYGLNIKQKGALDLLSLGAMVHRLDPGNIPWRKAAQCQIHVSGGEFNVAANLADCFRLQTGIATAIGIVWDTVVGIMKAALKILTGVFDVFIGIFTGNWERAWGGVKTIFEGIWDAIVAVFSGAWELVKATWDTFSSLFTPIWGAFWEGLKIVFFGIIEGIKIAFQAMVDFIVGIWDGISGIFEDVGNFFNSLGEGFVEFLGFDKGGLVQGRPGRDSIPARLTDGEFVVNAESTARNRDLLEMLNRDPNLLAGGGGTSLSFAGGLELNFPSVRTARDAREISEELDRLDARGQRSLNRRGSR